MKSTWPLVSLNELLTPVNRPVPVKTEEQYRQIGIRSHGKGVFHKAPVSGMELGNKKVFWVKPGDFVLNIVFAWEGAVALLTNGEDGMIASHRFPCFRASDSRLDMSFLSWFFRTPRGVDMLGSVSPGGAGRNRTLSKNGFLTLKIPLPPLAEQRRIVARIEGLVAEIDEAQRLRVEAAREVDVLLHQISAQSFLQADGSTVGDRVKFQTGYAFKSEWFSEEGVRLARNANIGHGTLDWRQCVRVLEERRAEFTAFELGVGDILVTLDRPIISTGVKVARVRDQDLPCLLLQRVARACFRDSSVLPDYFFLWLHSPHFTRGIDPGRSNGVPHISHKEIEGLPFAVPSIEDQCSIVAQLDALHSQVDTLKRLQSETAAELEALLPAILDRAFKGEL